MGGLKATVNSFSRTAAVCLGFFDLLCKKYKISFDQAVLCVHTEPLIEADPQFEQVGWHQPLRCSLSCQPQILDCSVICILHIYDAICAFVPLGPKLTYYSEETLIEQHNGFQTTAFHIPSNLIAI